MIVDELVSEVCVNLWCISEPQTIEGKVRGRDNKLKVNTTLHIQNNCF